MSGPIWSPANNTPSSLARLQGQEAALGALNTFPPPSLYQVVLVRLQGQEAALGALNTFPPPSLYQVVMARLQGQEAALGALNADTALSKMPRLQAPMVGYGRARGGV